MQKCKKIYFTFSTKYATLSKLIENNRCSDFGHSDRFLSSWCFKNEKEDLQND